MAGEEQAEAEAVGPPVEEEEEDEPERATGTAALLGMDDDDEDEDDDFDPTAEKSKADKAEAEAEAEADGDDMEGAERGDDGGEVAGDAEAAGAAGATGAADAEATPNEPKRSERKKKKRVDSDEEEDLATLLLSAKRKKQLPDTKLRRLARGDKAVKGETKAKKKKSKEDGGPAKKGTAKRTISRRRGEAAAEPPADGAGDKAAGGEKARRRAAAADAGDSEDDGPGQVTAEDRAFVAGRIEDLVEGEGGHAAEEALEADDAEDEEFENIWKPKSKRKGKDKTEEEKLRLADEAKHMVGGMESAALADKRSREKGDVPVKKLAMLQEVSDFLAKTDNHLPAMDQNILHALRTWLEPLPDRSLPNLKVRTAILSALAKMPIDTHNEDAKEQLKSSGLGRYVMLYSKLPEETPANRKLASSLVEKWSRPLFELSHQYKSMANEYEEVAVKERVAKGAAHAAAADLEDDGGGAATEGAKKRYRALPPERALMDYTRRPESKVSMEDVADVEKDRSKGGQRILEKIKTKKGHVIKKASAVKVSIEGRGLVLQL